MAPLFCYLHFLGQYIVDDSNNNDLLPTTYTFFHLSFFIMPTSFWGQMQVNPFFAMQTG